MSWPMVKLGEIFTISRGGSPRPIQDYITDSCNGVNWIMIGDTEPNSKYIRHTAKKIKLEGVKKSRKVYPGDLLLTNSMSFGRPYILDVEGCIHDGWLVLSPKNNQIHIDYFYHYLNSPAAKIIISNKAAGAVVKNLNSDIVRKLEIPFPPFAEQVRIASTLDKVDGIRQKREKTIKLADDFLRAIFLEMFGDPVTNKKKWPLRRLNDICNNVIDCPHSTPKWIDNGTICIRTSNLSKGGWVWSDKRFVSEETYVERTKRSVVDEGDIILSREGTVGVAAIVPKNLKLCMGQRLVQLKLDKNQVVPEYLLSFLLYELDPVRISRVMSGSTSKHINVSELKQLNVMLPSMKEQKLFAEIRNKIINISTKAKADHFLFEALSSQLMS